MPCQDWRVQLCSKTWLECCWVTIYSWIHTNTHLSVTATSLDSPYSQSCFYLSVRVTLLYGYGHLIVSQLLFKINASQSKQSTILTHNWELCQANLAYSDYEYMAATFIEHLFTHIKLKAKWPNQKEYYSITEKTVNTWNISGMFILLWPITAKTRTHKLPKKPQSDKNY